MIVLPSSGFRSLLLLFARAASAALLLTAATTTADAADVGTNGDVPPYTRTERVVYTATSQSLHDTESTIEYQVNTWASAESLAQQRESVNSVFEDLEVVEAATLKADGRRIDVPADKILTQRGNNESKLFNVDQITYTMVFPDVAPGDRIRYVVRRKQKEEQTPGGFSISEWAVPTNRYVKFEVAFNMPSEMQVHMDVTGFTQKEVRQQSGRTIHEWTLNPLPYAPAENNSVSLIDHAPHVWISSFKDTRAVGDAFCARAMPKAEVTPAISGLAAQITAGVDGRREQARAIFDWVASNVRYVAIELGAGGMVPNPAPSILANRYGDCKDYSTLMRALLAAKGIEAELVEINSSKIYKAFPIPFQHYDHAILYIPEFGQYVDPTATYSTFDRIPDYLNAKHTLICGNDGKVRASRVPPTSEDEHTLTVTGRVTIRPDGSAAGDVEVTGTGSNASDLRHFMSRLERSGTEAVLQPMFDALNVNGTGKIEGRASLDHTEPYTVKMNFTIDDSHFGEANAMVIGAGPDIVSEPFRELKSVVRAGRKSDFPCYPNTFRMDLTYTLPPGWTARLPIDVEQKAGPAEFTARYELRGQTVEVHRRYVLRTRDSVCPASMAATLAPVIKAAIHDSETWLPVVPDTLAQAARN